MTRTRILAVCLVMFAPLGAGAQTSRDSIFSCADFRHNDDGSWTTLAPVNVGGISMSAGISFTTGVQMNGIDVAQHLDRDCPR